jgi:hypothetical protein
MLIPWKSGRLAALAVASALAACGSNSGGGACSFGKGGVGCVDLLNFSSGYAEINGVQVPPPSVASGGGTQPGTSTLIAPNTAVGSKNTFAARVSGADAGTATCEVTATSWADVNPRVVLQQANYGLTCSTW